MVYCHPMTPRYQLAPQPDEAVRTELAAYDELTQQLLATRGVTTKGDAERFFSPVYEDAAHDPFLLADMDVAVARIIRAIDAGEHIALYTDFDADGIPAGALLRDALAKVGHTACTNYIPHRDAEGYGFHVRAVDTLARRGVTLIITADVGITDGATVSYAKGKGIDVIITDHHLPGEELPDAVAVVNPQRLDDFYPCPHLSGSGVAFKVVQGVYKRAREEQKPWIAHVPEGWEKWLLDLVAIATVADMVPLVAENRALVHYGLLVLRKSPRPGIGALCKKMRLQQRFVTEDDIGFSIAPRINASSRMGSPEVALELLTTDDEARAADLASALESLNNKRKGHVAAIVRELNKRIPADVSRRVIVAGNPSWNPALLGLAANSLVGTHRKTVCLWGRDGSGTLRGSCRGNGEVHVVELLRAVEHALAAYGGHEHAGGFCVAPDQVHTLPDVLEAAFDRAARDTRDESVAADAELDHTQLEHMYRVVQRFAPFGVGNPKPVFLCRDVHIHAVRTFGKEDAHVEIHIGQRASADMVRAIAFFTRPEAFTRTPDVGRRATVVCTLERSRFAGRVQLELRIVDIV